MTVAVVDEQRVLAAVEYVHAVLGIDRHAGDVAVHPAFRQLLPVVGHLIAVVTLPNDHTSPPRGAFRFVRMIRGGIYPIPEIGRAYRDGRNLKSEWRW